MANSGDYYTGGEATADRRMIHGLWNDPLFNKTKTASVGEKKVRISAEPALTYTVQHSRAHFGLNLLFGSFIGPIAIAIAVEQCTCEPAAEYSRPSLTAQQSIASY